MIYTVTLNPSLDYVAVANTFNIGKTNRTENEYFVPGGKGINVSVLLSRLGSNTTALGFSGGFTGAELRRMLNDQNINCNFKEVSGNTRINVKLSRNEITEFNGSGITVTKKDIFALKEKISELKHSDWLCLSGSLPKGADSNTYLSLAESAGKDVKVVVDATGETLMQALKAKPFLIKPNIDELCDLFGLEGCSVEEVKSYAEKLREMGAKNVLVSLGGEGALLLDMNGNTHFQAAHKGRVINTVGAGDSMIAGFIHCYEQTKNFEQSLKFAVSAGSATAFSRWLAEKDLIENLYNTL